MCFPPEPTKGSPTGPAPSLSSRRAAPRFSAGRLSRRLALRCRRNRPDERISTSHLQRLSVVRNSQSPRAAGQRILRLTRGHVNAEAQTTTKERERQACQPIGKPRRKLQDLAVVPHPAETDHESDPCASK
jgi:hypothetical protein